MSKAPSAFSMNVKRHAGFSLVELLVVVVIMSILATIGLPLSELARKRTQEEELRQSLREIRAALDEYKNAAEQGYIVRSTGDSGYPPNLGVLVSGVVNIKSVQKERIVFLRRLPRDPFASEVGVWGLRSYISTADEPKAGTDVYDIYSTSVEIGMNGVPYRKW